MTQCSHEDCEAEATHALLICVPATGYPSRQGRDLEAVLGVELCKSHALEYHAELFFGPESVKGDDGRPIMAPIFEVMARASGSDVPPDFTRAYVNPLPLTDERVRVLKEKSDDRKRSS